MAHSLSEELRQPPSPARLANMVLRHSFDDRSQPGTDVEHSGLRSRRQRQDNARPAEAVAAPDAAANGSAAAQGGNDSSEAGPRAAEGRCVGFDEAPRYLRREFVLSGYYVGGTHLASARRTLFGWNNETLNAWTMIAGLVASCFFWALARVHFPQHWAPFALMAASAVPHAPFSVALHATIGVSERTRDVLRTLDVFFILTCGVPRGLGLAWFVLSSPKAYSLYAGIIAGDWAWSVVSTCLLRRIKDIPKPQLARDVGCIVLCYTFPLFAAAAAELWHRGFPGPQTALLAAIVALLYVAGWLYSRHLPERWRPGAYDLVGNSHQWMHALVVAEYSLECCFVMYRAALASGWK